MTYRLVMLVLVSRCMYLNDICLIKTGQFLRAENIHLQNIKCSSVVTMNNTVIIWRSYYYQKQLFIVFTPTPISYCEYEKCPISKKKLQKLKERLTTILRSTTCLQIVGNFSVYNLFSDGQTKSVCKLRESF